MTAYEIIQQHPEWVESERTPRAAIQKTARRYVRELEGSKNFSDLITEDLDDLLRQRDATNDFAGIVANSSKTQVSTDSPDYVAGKRKAQIYAIFVKAVISELSEKAVCTAAQVEQWRERYAVKLEGLQTKPEKGAKANGELRPISDLKTEKIYTILKRLEYIDCNEDVFLWHFGERKNREGKPHQDKIKWKGEIISVFSIVGDIICSFAGSRNAKWSLLRNHFNIEWTNYQLTQGKQDALESQEREEIKTIVGAFEKIRIEEKEKEMKDTIEKAKKEAINDYRDSFLKV